MSEQTSTFAPTQNTSTEPHPKVAGSKSSHTEERRVGPADRRIATLDRRNEDRLNDDLLPRRNPDVPDRRLATG